MLKIMTNKFYFKDVDDLVNHLLYCYNSLSQVKLQKGLYFLFTFYICQYRCKEQEGIIELEYDYPEYLFEADFQAWRSGPVIKEVYDNFKNGRYHPQKYQFGTSDIDKEIQSFIKDVFKIVMNKSDFALIDRSQQDREWKNSILQGESSFMSIEEISKQYLQNFNDLNV